MTAPLLDRLGRPLANLRLSVTDRCNMRCSYCMPDDDYVWLPRESLLTYEEATRMAGLFVRLGVTKIRLTGGEPLLRKDLHRLVRMLAAEAGLDDLALTTNGVLLAEAAADLRAAGLKRVTVSLDTLVPERMVRFAKSTHHAQIIQGIEAAQQAGFESIKLNSVIVRGFNDDEIVPLLEFGRQRGIEVRFIEYMDVGGATHWRPDKVVSRAEILDVVRDYHGAVLEADPPASRGAAPAERFQTAGGLRFGIIASTTAPFCGSCDRSRVTADGTWYLCLYGDRGVDLRTPLREGWSDQSILQLIEATWHARFDRGAEERLALPSRGILHPIAGLRADPRREMHTRGG